MSERYVFLTSYLVNSGVLLMMCDFCGHEAIKSQSTTCDCPRCGNLYNQLLTNPELIKLGEELKAKKTNIIKFPLKLSRVLQLQKWRK